MLLRQIVFCLVTLWSSTQFLAAQEASKAESISAEDHYLLGLDFYLDNDFESARKHWFHAAKMDNAVAMFNLGLLNEQGRVTNGGMSRALSWYRFAAGKGYMPASYHLAVTLLAANDEDEEGLNLLRQAATSGYKPAVAKLSDYDDNSALRDLPDRVAGESERNSIGAYRTEEWLLSRKSSMWTIQLLAFEEESKVRAFIDDNSLHGGAAYFKDVSGSTVFYKLVYGAYETKSDASRARHLMPEELKEHGPWLRSIENIKEAIRPALAASS
ncbi:MAG: SPOR domain-containing protein [Pseudomonadota bacterium]